MCARGKNTLERCRTREKDRTPEQKNNHLSSSLFEKQAYCTILIQKTRPVSKLHSKNEEKGEAQFRKNRKFAEIDPHFAHSGRSGRCLRASPAASVDRSIYFHPQITPTHEAISTSRSHCPAEPERRRANTYIHRQAHGGARRKIGHHRTPHRDGLPHRARR